MNALEWERLKELAELLAAGEVGPYRNADEVVSEYFVAAQPSAILPLLAVVRSLAERDAPTDGEFMYCLLCQAEIPFDPTTDAQPVMAASAWYGRSWYDQRGHEPDCPWRVARELLSIPLNRIAPKDRKDMRTVPAAQVEHLFLKDGHALEKPS